MHFSFLHSLLSSSLSPPCCFLFITRPLSLSFPLPTSPALSHLTLSRCTPLTHFIYCYRLIVSYPVYAKLCWMLKLSNKAHIYTLTLLVPTSSSCIYLNIHYNTIQHMHFEKVNIYLTWGPLKLNLQVLKEWTGRQTKQRMWSQLAACYQPMDKSLKYWPLIPQNNF